MRSFLAAATAALVLGSTAADAQTINPLSYPQPEDGSYLWAFIEIPAGGITKYETDAETGQIVVDRFLSMPVTYPANYGSVTMTKNADGDPLDILVLTREPVAPGSLIKVRPIGIIKMTDGGDQDDKVVAVPVSKVDPTYDAVKAIGDLPKADADRMLAFFRVYKDLPEGSKKVVVEGLGDEAAAKVMVETAMKAAAAQ